MFSRVVPDEMGSKRGSDIFMFQSYNLELFVLIALCELQVSYDYINHG